MLSRPVNEFLYRNRVVSGPAEKKQSLHCQTWQKCVKWYYLVADDIRTYIHIVVAWASDLPSAASIVSLERSSDRIKMGGICAALESRCWPGCPWSSWTPWPSSRSQAVEKTNGSKRKEVPLTSSS
eukprot:s3548_g4.t1